MRHWAIAAAGLAVVTGCAGGARVDDTVVGAMETVPDPEDETVKACLTVVSLNLGTPDVAATGIVAGPEGSAVTVLGDGDRYRCEVDADGRVTAMIPLSGRR